MEELANSVISGNAPKAEELVRQTLVKGITPEQILNAGLIAGMDVVGEKYKRN